MPIRVGQLMFDVSHCQGSLLMRLCDWSGMKTVYKFHRRKCRFLLKKTQQARLCEFIFVKMHLWNQTMLHIEILILWGKWTERLRKPPIFPILIFNSFRGIMCLFIFKHLVSVYSMDVLHVSMHMCWTSDLNPCCMGGYCQWGRPAPHDTVDQHWWLYEI